MLTAHEITGMEYETMSKSVEAENVCTGKYKPHAKPPISQDLKRGEQKNTEQEQCNHIPLSNHYQQIFPNQTELFLAYSML